MAEPYRYTGWLLRKDASARTRDKEGVVFVRTGREAGVLIIAELFSEVVTVSQPVPGEEETDITDGGFAPIFPDICYHLTHYKPAAADIPVASDNPAHYADAIRYNARTPLQGSLLPLTRLVWA